MRTGRFLPAIADLRGRSPNGEVVLVVIVSKTGDVTHVRAIQGEPVLFKRSEDAAMKWHYKAFALNGIPIEFDSMLTFRFKRNKVEVVVPPH